MEKATIKATKGKLSVTFTLRSKSSKGLTDVYARFTIRGKRLVYPTGLKVLPKYWSKSRSEKLQFKFVSSKMTGYSDANQELQDLHYVAQSQFRRFIQDNGRIPTVDELKTCLDTVYGKNEIQSQINLFQFFDLFIERRTKQMINEGKRVTGNTTLTVYRQTQRLLEEFATATRTKVDFETISLELYENWVEYMQDVKEFKISNIGKHIKTLKTVLNDALEQGLTDNRAHQSKYFKTLKDESFSIALIEQELQDIHELDLSQNKGLDEQRDVFIVASSTGLRFSDVSRLTKKNIHVDNGRRYIQIKTQKTGETVSIPLDKRLTQILDKYKDTERGFPIANTNQVINRQLKEICKRVESLNDVETINYRQGAKDVTEMKRRYELVTTHTARRSFATNYYKAGVPPQFIMKITGHRTESAFLRYIKMSALDSAKVFELIIDKNNLSVVK
jgi:integrase